MKKIFYLPLLILLFIAVESNAQSLTGKILDETGKQVEFANVVLLSLPDSTFIAGSITNEQGIFVLDAKKLEGILRVSSVGYVTNYKKCNGSPDIGIIQLHSDTQLLGEVVIKANLPITRIKGDALITSVQNSVLSKAGSANDVLGKVPGIMKKQDSFEVFGKGAPLIFINGRQVRDDSELDQLNSEDIKQVEVITNPGARYDATVKAVIRIQTVRRKGEGFGFDVRSSYYQSKNVDLIEQVNMNYRHNSLDLFGTFRYTRNEHEQEATVMHTLTVDTLWQHQSILNANNVRQSLKGELGANYSLNENHSLGLRYSLTASPETKSDMFTTNTVTADNEFYDWLNNQEHSVTSNDPIHQVNVYYNGNWGDLNMDFNVDYYTNSSTRRNFNKEISQENENRDVHSQNYIKNKLVASKLIFSYPLLGGTVSVGGEYTNTHRKDEYLNEENYVEASFSKVEESGINAFVEYMRRFKLGNLSLGVRYEHVEFDYYKGGVHMDGQSRNYGNWYPHLSFSSQIGRVQTQLSYTAKTRRPTYRQLSNNITYIDRFTLQQGNPLLEPCTIHDISFIGTWRFMQLLISYQQQRDAIMYCGIPQDDKSSIMTLTYMNYHNLPSLSAFLSISPKIGIWQPNLSIGMLKQWMTVDNGGIEMKLNKPRLVLQFANSFELPGGFLASVDMNFYGKGNEQNSYFSRNYYNLDMSIRKSFLKDALSIELRGSDLLNQARDYSRSFYNRITWEQNNRYDTREFGITLRYKFNTIKSKYKGKGAANNELKRL